jgi:hypothetical protein
VIRVVAAVAAALACVGAAHATDRIALPSPTAPLSREPPLAGGARTSAENVMHSVSASTNVVVAIDDVGTPFAVTATQRLDVRGVGDYFFTIGAPVLTVRAPANSDSVPGMRTGSILWAGFNPGTRVLVARAMLDPSKTARALPLRVRVHGGTVVLDNETSVSVGTFGADAPREPLVSYLARLRDDVARGRSPLQVTVPLSSTPVDQHIAVAAPLHVTGTIGRERIDLLLRSRVRIHGTGRIDLRVEPGLVVDDITATGGRTLLRAAIRATLMVARANQYEEFLGNPDPAGPNRTVYAYRTSSPPHAAPTAVVGQHRRSWITTVLVVGVIAAALAAAAALWARS